VEGHTAAADSRENYSLEIGTIQIVLDEPAPEALRPAPAARAVEPARTSSSRFSRHYLRF
jgi:hypothetical protein